MQKIGAELLMSDGGSPTTVSEVVVHPSDCLWHRKTLVCLSEFGIFTVDFPITLHY